jgi:hypothetical protein
MVQCHHCTGVQYFDVKTLVGSGDALHGKIGMIDSMSVYEVIRNELTELIRLVRLEEQFSAVAAYGLLLPLDPASNQSHQHRVHRIDELLQKYGIIQK